MKAKDDQVGKLDPVKEFALGSESHNEDVDLEICNTTPPMLHEFHTRLIQCFMSKNLS